MTMYPQTVGELRKFLETYPDDLPIFAQSNTRFDPNAIPEPFVVEYWGSDPDRPFLLLAVADAPLSLDTLTGTLVAVNDPNASFNLPKQMKIQDDIDIAFDPTTYVEIVNTAAIDKLPALFYRVYKDGIMIQNGWIERKQMEELRELINKQLVKYGD